MVQIVAKGEISLRESASYSTLSFEQSPPVFMWEAKTARRQILERKVGQKDAIVLFGKRQSIVAAAVEEVVATVAVVLVLVEGVVVV